MKGTAILILCMYILLVSSFPIMMTSSDKVLLATMLCISLVKIDACLGTFDDSGSLHGSRLYTFTCLSKASPRETLW